MYNLRSERPCQRRQEKRKRRMKIGRGAGGFPCPCQSSGRTQSCGKSVWSRRTRSRTGGQAWRRQGMAVAKLHQSGIVSRRQRWGFADPWPSVSQPGILSNEIHSVKRVRCVSEPDSRKVEEKKRRRLIVERRQWISAQTLRVAVAVGQEGAAEGKWEEHRRYVGINRLCVEVLCSWKASVVFEVNLLNTCAVCPLFKMHKAPRNHIFAFVLFELHSCTIILLPALHPQGWSCYSAPAALWTGKLKVIPLWGSSPFCSVLLVLRDSCHAYR